MNRHRRIQPKAVVEHETVSLRLPAEVVRAVDQYAKYPGGSTGRTHVVTQALEIALAQDAEFQKSLPRQAGRPRGPFSPRDRVAAMPNHLEATRTAGGAHPVPPASPRRTSAIPPALSALPGGPSPFTRP